MPRRRPRREPSTSTPPAAASTPCGGGLAPSAVGSLGLRHGGHHPDCPGPGFHAGASRPGHVLGASGGGGSSASSSGAPAQGRASYPSAAKVWVLKKALWLWLRV